MFTYVYSSGYNNDWMNTSTMSFHLQPNPVICKVRRLQGTEVKERPVLGRAVLEGVYDSVTAFPASSWAQSSNWYTLPSPSSSPSLHLTSAPKSLLIAWWGYSPLGGQSQYLQSQPTGTGLPTVLCVCRQQESPLQHFLWHLAAETQCRTQFSVWLSTIFPFCQIWTDESVFFTLISEIKPYL